MMKKFGLLRHDQIIETRVQLSLYLLVPGTVPRRCRTSCNFCGGKKCRETCYDSVRLEMQAGMITCTVRVERNFYDVIENNRSSRG